MFGIKFCFNFALHINRKPRSLAITTTASVDLTIWEEAEKAIEILNVTPAGAEARVVSARLNARVPGRLRRGKRGRKQEAVERNESHSRYKS